MSLASLSYGVQTAVALKRHVVCFTGSEEPPNTELIAQLVSPVACEVYSGPLEAMAMCMDQGEDVNSNSNSNSNSYSNSSSSRSGVLLYIIQFPGDSNELDSESQSDFAHWLYRCFQNGVAVILVCQHDPNMIPYLRHQFWYACGESIGESEPMALDSTALLNNVHVHHTIKRYILDLIVHLRMHRLSRPSQGGGAHSRSLADMMLLCKWIALQSKCSFVTPDMVQIACQRYFPWHLQLIESSRENPSVMYGSREDLVDELISKFDTFGLKMQKEYNNPLFKQLCVVQSVMKNVIPAT